MRWVLRALCLAALAVAVVALVDSRWLQRTREMLSGTSQPAAAPGGESEASIDDRGADSAGDTSVGDEVPDDARPPLENPLVRGLDQVIESQPEAFGESGDGLRDQLAEADALLTEAKQRNRDAMRRANRQVRIAGRSSNLVLVVVRNLLQQDLACYGWSPHVTPQMDVMAAEGVRVEEFYGTAHATDLDALLTGRTDGKPASGGTLPEVLWQAGYTTALVGDGSAPAVAAADAGFDSTFGFRETSDARVEFPEFLWSNRRRLRLPANANGSQGVRASELFVDEAVSYLKRHRRGRPFALLVSLNLPAVVDSASDRSGVSAVEKLDLQIGRVLSALDDLNLDQRTLVVLAGVRGEDRRSPSEQPPVEPGLRQGPHGLYEGDLRLPLLVRWPRGQVSGGRAVRSPGRLEDLLPTLAEAAGAFRRPRNIDGVSVLDAWRDRDAAQHPDMFWRSSRQPGAMAARSGSWKAVRLPDGKLELYFLEDDAAEANDLAPHEPELRARFEEFFASRLSP